MKCYKQFQPFWNMAGHKIIDRIMRKDFKSVYYYGILGPRDRSQIQ